MNARAGAASPLSQVESLAARARADDDALRQLLQLLDVREWIVRRAAIAALAALAERAIPALAQSLQADRASETRIAATVDTLVASAGDVEELLIPLLPSADVPVVADIAQILGRRRNPRSIPVLTDLLAHTDDNVAVIAIEALGRVGGRAAVEALVQAVERDYFFRTYPAIDVLGRSGDPRAVAPLSRLVRRSEYVLEAARALGRTADKAAVSPLSELLVSPADNKVRVAALALVDLIESQIARYGSAAQALEALRQSAGEAAARRVSQTLAGADAQERVALCVLLGALQNEAAADALVPMLDAAPAVASAAAAALKQLGRGADDQMRRALADGDSARRRALLPLFPRAGGTAVVLVCLEDPDASVRALACDALARMGDASVVAALFDHLSDENPRVVQAAIGAIQSLGTNETEALATAAARSASASTRRAALRILAYFGYASAIEVFAAAKADADPRVQDVAIAGLALLAHPRALSLLLEAASADVERVRSAAMRGLGQRGADPAVIAALRRGLSDPEAWVRYYACQALGKLRVIEAVDAIVALLADPAGQVQVAAVEALSHLDCAPAHLALQLAAAADAPDVRRAALIGLGMSGRVESLPVLIAACTAPEAATRLVALSTLGGFRSTETLAVVADALRDSDEGVRDTAISVLAEWPGSAATRILIAALEREVAVSRITAVLATPVPGRVEGLLAALEGAHDELAPLLTSALGRVDPSDFPQGAMFSALRLPNVPARKAAAAMLAARASREAFAALADLAINDPSDEVRRICGLYLVQ